MNRIAIGLALIVVVAGAVIATVTSDGNAEQRDAAEVLAAAVRRLLTVDHGFGVGNPAPFTVVHIGDASLRPLERERIAAVIEEIGIAAQFVEDPDGLIQKLFNGPPQDAAVLVIDALRLEPRRAEVELHLWCGSLCAVFVTYEVVQEGGEWFVTGPVGPIAMS